MGSILALSSVNWPEVARNLWPYLQRFVDDAIARQRKTITRFDLNSVPILRVKEGDGSPNVIGVQTIVVSNDTLTDDGSGQVTVTTGGGGGGGAQYVWHVDSANMTTGVLSTQYNSDGGDSLTTARFATNATCTFELRKNGTSQGSASPSGSSGTASISTSTSTGDILSVEITAVTSAGRLTITWV